MSNTKPAASAPRTPPRKRSGRRRRVTAGTLPMLQREMWYAVRRIGEILDDPDADNGDIVRAANALAALANSYRGVHEQAELLPRLEAIEQELDTPNHRRAA